jgi:hypothetical protein
MQISDILIDSLGHEGNHQDVTAALKVAIGKITAVS